MAVSVSKRLAVALLLAGVATHAEAQDLCVVEECTVESSYVSGQRQL
jgi:hypothetical protein